MKTTNPKRYLVKPSQGLVPAHGEGVVTISLQGKENETLLTKYRSGTLDQSKVDSAARAE